MDMRLLGSVFGLVFVAELPGKTTFAAFLMAARGRPRDVLLGAAAAFAVHGLIAVAAGRLLGLLPPRAVSVGVGLLFLALAALIWHEKIEDGVPALDSAAKVFGVIFAAQWGDPSQLATAAMAARHAAPATVFLGATAALWSVCGLAVLLGHHSRRRVHPAILQKIAGAGFAAAGVVILARTLL